jgi:hypothetical protein
LLLEGHRDASWRRLLLGLQPAPRLLWLLLLGLEGGQECQLCRQGLLL